MAFIWHFIISTLQEEAARRPKTAEEKLAEKLRQQKIQEEADLQLAKEVLGVNSDVSFCYMKNFVTLTKIVGYFLPNCNINDALHRTHTHT